MADRIVVMNAGRIEQIGTPEDVYERPNSEFVARFIGGSNVINATHLSGHRVEVAGHTLDIGQGNFAGPGEPMSFCVKTHDVELWRMSVSTPTTRCRGQCGARRISAVIATTSSMSAGRVDRRAG